MQNLANMSHADLLALAQRQQAALASQAKSKITLKVGQSGTVSLYHGSRYPVALYAEQWERLIPFFKSGAIEEFIEANRALLKFRED